MKLTYEEVARILAILDMAQGADLDFALDGWRIEIASWQPESAEPSHEAASQAPEGSAQSPAITKAAPAGKLQHQGATPAEIRAHQPGYYRRVHGKGCAMELGTQIKQGDLLGAIAGLDGRGSDVLAPQDGVLVELCVAEDDFVEYGQVIAVVEPVLSDPRRSADESEPKALSE